MKKVTELKELKRSADRNLLNAVLKRYGDNYIGRQVLRVEFFTDNGECFYFKPAGLRVTSQERKSKNYNFFI